MRVDFYIHKVRIIPEFSSSELGCLSYGYRYLFSVFKIRNFFHLFFQHNPDRYFFVKERFNHAGVIIVGHQANLPRAFDGYRQASCNGSA